MVDSIEPILALHWLNSILTTDGELNDPVTGVRGWHEIAPANVLSPYGIVRQLTGAADLLALDYGGENETIWVPCIMQVIIYDRVATNYSRIGPLAARAYSLLQRASGTTPLGVVYATRRTLVRVGPEPVGDAVERFAEQQFTLEARSE